GVFGGCALEGGALAGSGALGASATLGGSALGGTGKGGGFSLGGITAEGPGRAGRGSESRTIGTKTTRRTTSAIAPMRRRRPRRRISLASEDAGEAIFSARTAAPRPRCRKIRTRRFYHSAPRHGAPPRG